MRNLGRLRLHDLRHTAASQAVMAGEGLPLGRPATRAPPTPDHGGYAHLADSHLLDAAERVGKIIAKAMATAR